MQSLRSHGLCKVLLGVLDCRRCALRMCKCGDLPVSRGTFLMPSERKERETGEVRE